MRSYHCITVIILGVLSALISLIVCLGCESFSPSGSTVSQPDDIPIIEVVGTVQLPVGSPSRVEDIVVSTLWDTGIPDSSGAFTVQARAAKKHQLFIAENRRNGNAFALAYSKANTNGLGVDSRSTAVALIMANPLFGGSTADQRDTIIAQAKKDHRFTQLRNSIHASMASDPNHNLDFDSHNDWYEQAARIAIDVLKSFGSEDSLMAGVAPLISGKPIVEETLHNGKLRFKNPRFVYYGASLERMGDHAHDACRLTAREQLIELVFILRWPPWDSDIGFRKTSPEYTDYALEDGQYNVLLTMGFDEPVGEWIDLNTANGKATLSNIGKGLVFTMDILFGEYKHPMPDVKNLNLVIREGSQLALESSLKGGFSWRSAGEFINVFVANNATNIAYWYFQRNPDNVGKITKAHDFLRNAASIVDKLLLAETLINKAVPFFTDLATAPRENYFYVEKDGDSIVVKENHPPNKPVFPLGPGFAYTGRTYQWESYTTDPDHDDVAINILWGDGTESGFSDFFPEGTAVLHGHAFQQTGKYGLVASAKDINGIPSELSDTLWVTVENLPVQIDIRPGIYPNKLSSHGQGDVQIAVLGTNTLEVLDIDPGTVTVEGVLTNQWWNRDVSQPLRAETDCGNIGTKADGYLDLVLKFRRDEMRDVLSAYPPRINFVLTVLGRLTDGTQFEGSDCAQVVNK